MKKLIIPYIPGDGIGPEITETTIAITNAVMKKTGEDIIQWEKLLAGREAFDSLGTSLPEETIKRIEEIGFVIKGPMGTPTGGGHRSLNVALRKTLDLNACIRPIKYYDGAPSPLKNPHGIDLVIFRENTEDLYAGIEFKAGSEKVIELQNFLQKLDTNVTFSEKTAIGIKPISEYNSKRIAKDAINYALTNKIQRITIMHKGNIMKYTEGQFRSWIIDVANQYKSSNHHIHIVNEDEFVSMSKDKQYQINNKKIDPKIIIIDSLIADNTFAQVIKYPQQFGIIIAPNLNGDYISDAAAETIGGLGMSGGININYTTGKAMAEATHGTADAIAGQNKANAISHLLSQALLLKHLGFKNQANIIEQSIVVSMKSGNQYTLDLLNMIHNENPLYDKQIKALSTTEQRDNLLKIIENINI